MATDDPRWIDCERNVMRCMNAETDAACVLVNVLPTTMVGVVALLRYAVEADTDGEGWPPVVETDDGKTRSWRHFLLANLGEILPGAGMSNIGEFPLSDRPITEAEVDKLHSEGFRDLEGRISDCVWMSAIALEMAERTIEGREAKHEKAMFAVFEVANRLKQLKADYHAAWHGEKKASECT